MKKPILVLIFLVFIPMGVLGNPEAEWLLPIDLENRRSLEEVRLTPIGQFGRLRKARPKIPAHLHTGIDIKRPSRNYGYEPIFSAGFGRVISLRNDGPYAQIIIEHDLGRGKVWTVYEHIAGIRVTVGKTVTPYEPIARFMNKQELDAYGWQFDHAHFEILKKSPRPIRPDKKRPHRYFGIYNLVCYDFRDLESTYYHPFNFFRKQWRKIDNVAKY